MAQKKMAAAGAARKTVETPKRATALVLPVAQKAVATDVRNEVGRRVQQVAAAAAATPIETAPTVAPVAKVPAAKVPAAKAPVTKAPVAKAPVAKAPVEGKAARLASKGIGDLATVGQENLEACVKCGTIVAKGAETLGNEVMTFTQASIEADLAAAKNIMTAKTFREAIDLQTDFAQARLERMTSETAKLGELSMRLASQAMEPLRSRFDANAWTVFRPLGQ